MIEVEKMTASSISETKKTGNDFIKNTFRLQTKQIKRHLTLSIVTSVSRHLIVLILLKVFINFQLFQYSVFHQEPYVRCSQLFPLQLVWQYNRQFLFHGSSPRSDTHCNLSR